MSWLAEGSAAAQRMSAQEYFEMFYDWVDHDNRVWPVTMTPSEVEAVTRALGVVNVAVAELEHIHDDNSVIASGWLERISPVAGAARDLMLTRGCFDEEFEEREPSNRAFDAVLGNYQGPTSGEGGERL